MIDWHSNETDIFLNPRIENHKKLRYNHLLKEQTQLAGHIWFATSGTTGNFKCVALSKKALLCSARAVNEHFDSTSSDIWINVLPTFHVGGAGVFARSFLAQAKVINLYSDDKKWNPQEFTLLAEQAKATLSALVPTQLHDLVKKQIKSPKSLRAIIIGGGHLDTSLRSQALELGWRIYPSYGLTECASQVATSKVGQLEILNHIEAKIDPQGFILLKSPSLLTTYAFIEENTIRFYDPKIDGWFNTGDKGILDGKYLTVLGRGADFLKIGGESVNLQQAQSHLERLKIELKIVQETLLFPQKDERLGHIIAMCVEGVLTSEIQTLLEEYNKKVLPFERIRHIITVDTIQRTPLEKPVLKLF